MHHAKVLRWFRPTTIPAALLCVIVSACADQQPTGPELQRVSRAGAVPADRFFVAWAEHFSYSPIQMQLFTLDPRQEKQVADFADERVLSFARANPGRLYINGDEPDQYCVKPVDYAIWYHEFVKGVRSVDPTARFSPAGFAEPNYKCCPLPDDVPTPCWSENHSIGYAQKFYDAYVNRYGVAPPVDEWRFHNFGLAYGPGDLEGWWGSVSQQAHWSVTHGAKMVLASWGFMTWRMPDSEYVEYVKRAMGRMMSDSRISGSVYWSYQPWVHSTHPLANTDGSLTPAGQTLVNPLTDVPRSVAVIESENGYAKVQWSNTTSAWGAEVEFWVRASNSNSFVHRRTEWMSSPGAAETPLIGFGVGDVVRGRVRYYNTYGQAAWSSFSDDAVIDSGKKRNSGSGPFSCFLSKRIQSQSCA